MLVSIIIPAFNVEKYIEKCVLSVRNQSYKDLDIIIIDDGSLDNTAQICDKLASDDSRIRVVHKTNEGLSAARNDGIDMAYGEYICFLDADDGIHPQFVEKLLNQIDKYNCDIAQCDYFAKRDNDFLFFETCSYNYELLDGREAIIKCYDENYSTYNTAWAKIYHRKLFETIRFPIGRIREDEFTTWKILLSADRIVYLHEFLYSYTIHKESIMGSHDVKKHIDGMEAFWERACFLQENKYFKEAAMTFRMLICEANIALDMLDDSCCERDRIIGVVKEAEGRIKDLYYGYVFPFSKVHEGASVAIYGAGQIGFEYYKQLEKCNYVGKILWVDTYSLRDNDMVMSIDSLIDNNIDYVVIAVKTQKTADSIRKMLVTLGFDNEVIIWVDHGLL